MLAQTLDLGKISFSVLSFWYYHILFYTKCDYQIKNSQFQEFLVFWFLSFVFLTNWMSRFQESNSLIRNSQFLNFSYLGILEFAMNVGFSQNGFSANKIPSFQIPSFVTPTKTFLVLSFPVSCVNQMAQHARLLALLMAKIKGKSKGFCNMVLGQCIGLQHIQRSMSQVKNCGLWT